MEAKWIFIYVQGAAHGDELFLLFNLNVFLEARQGSIDYDASRVMVKAWTDFAKGLVFVHISCKIICINGLYKL